MATYKDHDSSPPTKITRSVGLQRTYTHRHTDTDAHNAEGNKNLSFRLVPTFYDLTTRQVIYCNSIRMNSLLNLAGRASYDDRADGGPHRHRDSGRPLRSEKYPISIFTENFNSVCLAFRIPCFLSFFHDFPEFRCVTIRARIYMHL